MQPICPYYVRESRKEIMCMGNVTDYIKLVFETEEKKKDYIGYYCSKKTWCRACEHHKVVTESVEIAGYSFEKIPPLEEQKGKDHAHRIIKSFQKRTIWKC